MTSKEFVIWLKGFTEACNDFTATPKQWDRIKEVLDEVEDDPGIDIEIDNYQSSPNLFPPNGTAPGWLYSGGGKLTTVLCTSGSANTFATSSGMTSATYLFPPGTNITYTNNTKQQLND
jgi:hypothetical protein